MPSGSFKQADVKCPYYRTDNGKNRIDCDGLIPDSVMHSYFFMRSEYKMQMSIFCCGAYWNCEICTALDNKYREDNEE